MTRPWPNFGRAALDDDQQPDAACGVASHVWVNADALWCLCGLAVNPLMAVRRDGR